MFHRSALAILVAALALAETPASRLIDLSDLTPKLQSILSQHGMDGSFSTLIRDITTNTKERLRDGEAEHLIYYLLQSKRFTPEPPIEPALSAREFVRALAAPVRTRYLSDGLLNQPELNTPAAVKKRMLDFIEALRSSLADERLAWFRKSLSEPERTVRHLSAEYARAMRFLYQKEFSGEKDSAGLYARRGHSSDTRVESSYAVWTALSILQKLDPFQKINRVLIVGPGLDFAPRTGFFDSYPPQSYQPWAIADALLQLGLADRSRLRIHCVDINDRVLEFFGEFRTRREPQLTLFASWEDPEYLAYFRALGHGIGAEDTTPGRVKSVKTLRLSKDALAFVTAGELNVITQRYDPCPEYDLVIATNVFVYFDNRELLLALSNIHSMLANGGYLIHNELRPELESYTAALNFSPLRAGSVRLSAGTAKPLYDTYVIHVKR
jgi:hypothetical protein